MGEDRDIPLLKNNSKNINICNENDNFETINLNNDFNYDLEIFFFFLLLEKVKYYCPNQLTTRLFFKQ